MFFHRFHPANTRDVVLFRSAKQSRPSYSKTTNVRRRCLQEVGLGLAVREQRTRSLVVHSLDQRETDLAVVELLDTVATALSGGDSLDLDDLVSLVRKKGSQIRVS